MNCKRGSHAPTYQAWCNMKTRCTNPRATQAHWYLRQGITVCPAWQSYEAFLTDMGQKPSGAYLDRINPALGYSPANCRWATKEQHLYNRSLRSDNTFGLKGLHFDARRDAWQAFAKKSTQLYYGKDFFEACCARKSWEVRYEQLIGL